MDYNEAWSAIIGCRTPSEAVIEFELDPTDHAGLVEWCGKSIADAEESGFIPGEFDMGEWADDAADELANAFGGTMLADGSWAVTDAAGGIWHPAVPIFDKGEAIRTALRSPMCGEWSS